MRNKLHKKNKGSLISSEPLARLNTSMKHEQLHNSEESNKMTSDSIQTVPKKVKKVGDHAYDQMMMEDINTCEPEEIKTQSQTVKNENKLWEEEINFDYFFQTLKDHPEDKAPKFQAEKEDVIFEADFSFEQEDQPPLLSRKKKQDLEWQSRFLNSKLVVNEENRRKSSRLQQIYQKERLQKQMKDMRASYYRAHYRYGVRFVRYRLSYLYANCLPFECYQCQTIDNIPSEPPFAKLSSKHKEITIQLLRKSLQSRLIKEKEENKQS